MKTSLERLPKSRVRLSIHVPQKTVQAAVDQAYQKFGTEVEIKGFRKGQAPKSMVFEAVGLARLREAIFQHLLPETYFEAIRSQKLVPVEGPRVDVKSQDWERDLPQGKVADDVKYEAEVDVLPEITLTKDYKKLKIAEKSEVDEIKDEEVTAVLDHLRRQQAQFKEIDRPAKEGDRIEIEFTGKVGGVGRDDFSSKNYPLILGQGTLLPEFEKELVGMKKGQEKTITLSVPSKQDHKQTERVEFQVKVLDVKEVILPEATDDFAKKVGQDSLLALRGAIRQSLKQNKEGGRRREVEQEIAEQLITSGKLEVPESLVHQEIHRMMDSLRQQGAQYGLTWEAYLAQLKKTEGDLHKELESQAEKTVKFGLILGYIMTKEGIDSKAQDAGKKTMDRLIEIATG